jgi:hypothetical protein
LKNCFFIKTVVLGKKIIDLNGCFCSFFRRLVYTMFWAFGTKIHSCLSPFEKSKKIKCLKYQEFWLIVEPPERKILVKSLAKLAQESCMCKY